jgi:hypothetical protein
MSSLDLAKETVRDWLKGEHDYQFDKNRITHNAESSKSIAYIMDTEIGNKWNRFQIFNGEAHKSSDRGLYLQSSQQLLKACGASRGALVWDYVANGQTIDQGSTSSWEDLDQYYHLLATDDTVPSHNLLSAELKDALDPASVESSEGIYNIKPVFTRLSGLAIAHLLEQEELIGEMLVPKPGTVSGEIVIWFK